MRNWYPAWINDNDFKDGFKGVVRKAAVIGDRLSPFVALASIFMAVANILVR